jgi:hypothetical protein
VHQKISPIQAEQAEAANDFQSGIDESPKPLLERRQGFEGSHESKNAEAGQSQERQ